MVDPIRLGLPEPITYHLVNQLRHQEIRGVETGDRCEFDYVDRMDPMFPEEAPKQLQYRIPPKPPGLRCTCRGYERGIEDIDVEGQVDILAEEGEDLIDPRLIRVNVIGEEEVEVIGLGDQFPLLTGQRSDPSRDDLDTRLMDPVHHRGVGIRAPLVLGP